MFEVGILPLVLFENTTCTVDYALQHLKEMQNSRPWSVSTAHITVFPMALPQSEVATAFRADEDRSTRQATVLCG